MNELSNVTKGQKLTRWASELKGIIVLPFSDHSRIALANREPVAMIFANEGEVAPVRLNQLADDGTVTVRIPYGETEHRSESGEVRRQVFDRADAEALVSAFRRNVVARLIGLPWFIGHPDHPEFRDFYTDTRAYGRIKSIEAKDKHLLVFIKFNESGKTLIREEAFSGWSPNWHVSEQDDGTFHPVSLLSIGFTNSPNMPVDPILANEGANSTDNPEQHTDMKFEALRALLIEQGLLAEDADDAAFEAALSEALSKSLANEEEDPEKDPDPEPQEAEEEEKSPELIEAKKKAAEAETALANERTALANERKARAELVVNAAVASGHILSGEADAAIVTLANSSDFSTDAAALTSGVAKMKTKSVTDGLGTRESGVKSLRMLANELVENGEARNVDAAFLQLRQSKPDLFAKAG